VNDPSIPSPRSSVTFLMTLAIPCQGHTLINALLKSQPLAWSRGLSGGLPVF
jgi:hypothetical protein